MERELLSLAVNGCDVSFAKLISLYGRYIRGVILKFIKTEEDIKDIEQDVWLKLFLNMENLYSQKDLYPDSRSFRQWLATCAANRCRDLLDSRKRVYVDIDMLADELPADIVNPLDDIHQNRVNKDLHEAILRLPIREREVVFRHYWGGYTSSHISKAMDTSLSAVESLNKRSKIRLRKMFRHAL